MTIQKWHRSSVLLIMSLGLTASMLATGGARAAEPIDPTRFILYWRVLPDAPSTGPVTVKRQGIVASGRLVPDEMRVANTPVLAADGTRLAPAGTQFARVDLPGNELYCTPVLLRTDDSAVASAWLGFKRRICLLGQGGMMTRYFSEYREHYYPYRLNARLPAKIALLQPTTLAEADPASYRLSPMVALHYQRFIDKGNWLQRSLDAFQSGRPSQAIGPDDPAIRFHLIVKQPGRSGDWFVKGCGETSKPLLCVPGTLPTRFSILGFDGTVLERSGEDIRIRLERTSLSDAVRFESGGANEGIVYLRGAEEQN